MGLPEERILVLPHACEDLLEGAEHAPPPAGAGALFFGRLAHPKGIDVVLRAWEELDVPLHVVGSGPSEPEVRALAERRPDVRWTPHISREGVAEAIRAAAFVVAPHLQHEAFGLTSIEAQACGRPVIASDLGGPAETIVAGETGALVPPGDIEAFAAEVRRFAEERDATRRMGAAARERYLAHYHPAPHGERLLAAFRGLVENRRRAA
ncbi:MAG: glycosyltransferase family 4 protein [Planctomycetota bacterium]